MAYKRGPPWFASKNARKSDSFTGSFLSSASGHRKGSVINPKLLEMVIKTINKRQSIAGEFQKGLAKTAAQTWNSHLAERRKMTRKQKVVEDIASNLGLAKGFRRQIQDDAERLVSILFKEIEKKKTEPDEISTDSTESTLEEEEEEEESIDSIKDVPEPIPKPPSPPIPPKKKVVSPHVHPLPFHSCTTHKKSVTTVQVPVEKAPPISPKIGLSFINVKEITIRQSVKNNENNNEGTIQRTYMEVVKTPPAVTKQTSAKSTKSLNSRKLIPKEDLPPKRDISKSSKSSTKSSKKSEKEFKKKRVCPAGYNVPAKKHTLRITKIVGIKGLENSAARPPEEWGASMPHYKVQGQPHARVKRITSLLVERKREKSNQRQEIERVISAKSASSLKEETTRASLEPKKYKKKLLDLAEEQIDQKTKEYIVQQIKDMLNMLTAQNKSSEVELMRQKRRERKSVVILWKNYLDIRNYESIAEESVGDKKKNRDALLQEVDVELVKTSIYGKIAAVIGEKSSKTPYERALWKYLYERARLIRDDKERITEKLLENNIQIHKEQMKKSQTPKDVRLEEERRQKAIQDYLASLDPPPSEKYCTKRPNARETTIEEILQMRGFRGPARNCKNTIWIKKPYFVGYLKPMKRKPKTVYCPKLSKTVSGKKSDITSLEETISEYEEFPPKICIKRMPAVVDDEQVGQIPHRIPKKRLKPYVKEKEGFSKYFGFLDIKEDTQSVVTDEIK